MTVAGSSKILLTMQETTHICIPNNHDLTYNFLTSSVFACQMKPEPLSQ